MMQLGFLRLGNFKRAALLSTNSTSLQLKKPIDINVLTNNLLLAIFATRGTLNRPRPSLYHCTTDLRFLKKILTNKFYIFPFKNLLQDTRCNNDSVQ